METKQLTIIGAGAAGLATAFYAKHKSISFTILEGSGRVGGNAATLRHGPFLYDTGAHRWHDRYPDITRDVKELLGDELVEINVPSQICSEGRFFDFPLSPLNLLRNLGLRALVQSAKELLLQKIKPHPNQPVNFRTQAIATYGKTIAQRFLLGYSEKLWGAPVETLSPKVAGKRLQGLNLKTFLLEAFRGAQSKTEHLDGRFYYPKFGIGSIAEKMAELIGPENIQLHSKVKRIHHQQNTITKVELEDGRQVSVQELVSSLPLTTLVNALYPLPPEQLLQAAASLQFRHLVLVVLFLDKASVSPNASLYFPDHAVPFTRLYEPRNRSPFMAPEGKTSAVIEIPASPTDKFWLQPDNEIIALVTNHLINLNLIRPQEIIGAKVTRVPFAYPVLLHQSEQPTQLLLQYLQSFGNLQVVGRAASFEYTHLHDHFWQAKEFVGKKFK